MLLTVILWVEARDAAKHSRMHRRDPCNKELLGLKVNSGEVEKPCREVNILLVNACIKKYSGLN